jgi:hypothetical protein
MVDAKSLSTFSAKTVPPAKIVKANVIIRRILQ